MPDSATVAPERTRPPRRTMTYLTVLILAFVVMAQVGDAVAPTLVDQHPLLLIALNARNRNLILVTNQLDAWSYYLVGTIRLLASDPLFFLVGYWYGDAAIVWMERRTKTLGKLLREWDSLFRKAMYPVLFIAPNNFICVFAGAAGMPIAGFVAVNVVGTLTRLYLIRWLGDAFDAPIDDVLGFIRDNRAPLLLVTIGLAAVFIYSEIRKGGPGLEEIEEIEEELAAEHQSDEDERP